MLNTLQPNKDPQSEVQRKATDETDLMSPFSTSMNRMVQARRSSGLTGDHLMALRHDAGDVQAYAEPHVVQRKEFEGETDGKPVGKQGWANPRVKERTTAGTRIRRIPVEGLPSVIAVGPGAEGGKALVLASHALDSKRKVDILLYYHGLGPGHGNGRDERRDQIEQQLDASGRNMIALLPQGSKMGSGTSAKQQFGADKTRRALNANVFIGEALGAAFPDQDFEIGGTILAAHSAGGDAVSEALTNPDLKPKKLKGVMLFEAVNRTTLRGQKGISSDELARNQQFLEAQMGAELETLAAIETDKAKEAWLKASGFRYFAHYLDGGDYAAVHESQTEDFGASDQREDRRKSLKVFLDDWFNKHASDLGGAGSKAYTAMRANYKVVKLTPKLGGGDHHDNVVGDHNAMRDGLNKMAGGEFIAAPEGEGAEDVKYGLGLFDKGDIASIMEGGWKDRGDYTWPEGGAFSFNDSTMQALLEYCTKSWAPGVQATEVKAAHMDKFKKSMHGEIMDHPTWVREFNTLLAGQAGERRDGRPMMNKQGSAYSTAFNRESHVAQRLVEAFLRAWHKKTTGSDTVNSNLAEMYGRVGFSETNDQALLAGGAVGLPNWCGPATEMAVALGLMKRGLRFKGVNLKLHQTPPRQTGNAAKDAARARLHKQQIAEAFRASVGKQAAHYLTKWASHTDGSPKDAGAEKRGAWDDAKYQELNTGDEIYLIHPGGPVSGHVATIIKEDKVGNWDDAMPGDLMSKVTYMSGNTKGAINKHGAYRPETFERELPPQDYDYGETAKWGNKVQELQDQIDARKRELGMATGSIKVQLQSCFIRRIRGQKGYPKSINGRDPADFWWGHMKDQEALAPHFGTTPGWAEYCSILEKDRNTPKDPKLAALERKLADVRNDPEAKGKPLTMEEMQSGRDCPKDANRIWVVSVVRASQLDANSINDEVTAAGGTIEELADGGEAGRAVLDKYGLTTMPGTIEDLWPGALAYYEGRQDVDAT